MSTVSSTQLLNIVGMDRAELRDLIERAGEPSYRAEQIMRWLHQRDVDSIDSMTNLSKGLRSALADQYRVDRLETIACERSQDGVTKLLMKLCDGLTIESVLIPEGKRQTACISSQAGCGIGCAFCATALGGFNRNLAAGEIVDQVRALEESSGHKVTNVVFMGMGEPFQNYANVIKAAKLLNDPWGKSIGARHITISTSGVVPMIERFTEERLQFVLAISLHAGTNDVRDRLVPLNRKYPIEALIDACRRYVTTTGRRVTFEYVMIDGVNDGLDQAEGVLKHAHGLMCHVNLIPLNAVPETGLLRSRDDAIERFAERLRKGGLPTTIRRERGADIQAACGQLRRSRPRA